MGDHHSDIHTDHHDEHVVFSKFHLWTQIPSTTLLLIVMILGSLANTFVGYCLYKKKIGTSYVNPVLLSITVKNIFAITLCVPLAIVMLNVPKTIQKVTCSIQEVVTYIVVFAGFLFPALLSVIQCDHIIRHQRAFFNSKSVKIVLFSVSGIAVILGTQSQIQNDDHGCHLWSIRTDDVVLTYIYSVATIVCCAFVVITTSYILIYHHARAHQAAISQMAQRRRDVSAQQGNSNMRLQLNKDTTTISSYVPFRRKMTTAILRPMFCIVANNLLTSLPWIILYTSTLDDSLESSAKYAEMRVLTMSIIYIPIAAEPIIFLAFSTKGRKALKTVWNNAKCKKGSVVPTDTGVSVIPDSAAR